MVRRITPDDISTNIGFREPSEVNWLGLPPRVRGFYAERGGSQVSDYYPTVFDAMMAYPDANITDAAMAQLTEGEKRMLAKPKDIQTQAGAENLVCLSEKFHTHPKYHDFYDAYADTVHGFTGIYDLVIRLAETLTYWEEYKGGKELYDSTEVIWDEIADVYIGKYFEVALADNVLPSAESVFKMIEPKKDQLRPQRPANLGQADHLEP